MNIHSLPAMTTSNKAETQTGADSPARPSRASLARLDGEAGATTGRPSRASLARLDGDAPARPSKAVMGRGVGDKREAITSAALDLFVERGFFGTAVPEIADRAGVGAGTIYRYFDSKEALVNALYRQEKLHWARVVFDDFPVAASPREQFRMLWTRMVKFVSSNEKSFVFLELHHHARYLDAESRAVEQRTIDLSVQLIHAAQARGDLKSGSPRLLIGIAMGAFIGVIRSCRDIEQPLDQADWKLAEQCVWEAIRS
jgi:AcrR family transcriptional regulator